MRRRRRRTREKHAHANLTSVAQDENVAAVRKRRRLEEVGLRRVHGNKEERRGQSVEDETNKLWRG